MIAIWSYIIAAAILSGLAILFARYFALWLQAYFTGTRISLLDLVLMSLRKADPRAIVQCKVMAVQSGLALKTSAIEAQYLAGGDVHRVTLALPCLTQTAHLPAEVAWCVCEDAFRMLAGEESQPGGSITSVAFYELATGKNADRYRFRNSTSFAELLNSMPENCPDRETTNEHSMRTIRK